LPTNAFDTAIQLSPDGRWLAAGLVDNSLWISPVPIQDRPRRIPDIQDLAEFPLVSMNSLDFSPDSTLFAVGCHDGNVTIWETRTGKRIARIHAHPDLVLSMSFSEDNRLLATVGRDQRVCVWKLPGGELVAEKRANHNRARSVAFLPGARELVTSADDQTIRLWSTTPATPHFGQFTNLPPNLLGAFTIPDGEHLSVLQHNGAGGILEIKTGRVTETWSGEDPTLAAAGMSARDGRLVSARVTKSGRVETVPFGGGNGHHWQITNWVQSGSLSGVSIELSRNLQHLAISDMMNGIRVWRIEDQATVAQLQNPGFHALALAPSKPWLAYVSRVAPPRIHDFQTHRDWSLSVPVGLCQACLFTQDERFFLTASLDGTVHVFDPQTGRELNKLRSRTPGLIALNATPDGSRIFAGSVDGFVTIWDPQAGREVAMFRAHTKPIMGMEFLTDGRLMTGAADGVRFWAGAPGR
jgi:WD40 repeat protein